VPNARRYAINRVAQRDAAEPAIVDALEQAGCTVYRHLPVDLLCWHPALGFRLLECKTPTKTGKRRTRHDQAEQDAFIAATGTPVVMTPEAALAALGLTG